MKAAGIDSLATSATQFAQIIRGHWRIENCLHWGGSALGGFPDLWRLPFKDAVFKEDTLPLKHHNAASNWSIISSYCDEYCSSTRL